MAITKKTITLEDNTTKDVYTETITETREQEITIDMVDSSITQIDSTITWLQEQRASLVAKKQEMLSL